MNPTQSELDKAADEYSKSVFHNLSGEPVIVDVAVEAFKAGDAHGFARAMNSPEVVAMESACQQLETAFIMASPVDPVEFTHNMLTAVQSARIALAAFRRVCPGKGEG